MMPVVDRVHERTARNKAPGILDYVEVPVRHNEQFIVLNRGPLNGRIAGALASGRSAAVDGCRALEGCSIAERRCRPDGVRRRDPGCGRASGTVRDTAERNNLTAERRIEDAPELSFPALGGNDPEDRAD